MPEKRETDTFELNKKSLGHYLLSKYEISDDELYLILHSLIDNVIDNVNQQGIIPTYAYIVNADELGTMLYNNQEYLGIVCSFTPIKKYIEDMPLQKDKSILFPCYATSHFNLSTGDYSEANVTWKENYFGT